MLYGNSQFLFNIIQERNSHVENVHIILTQLTQKLARSCIFTFQENEYISSGETTDPNHRTNELVDGVEEVATETTESVQTPNSNTLQPTVASSCSYSSETPHMNTTHNDVSPVSIPQSHLLIKVF